MEGCQIFMKCRVRLIVFLRRHIPTCFRFILAPPGGELNSGAIVIEKRHPLRSARHRIASVLRSTTSPAMAPLYLNDGVVTHKHWPGLCVVRRRWSLTYYGTTPSFRNHLPTRTRWPHAQRGPAPPPSLWRFTSRSTVLSGPLDKFPSVFEGRQRQDQDINRKREKKGGAWPTAPRPRLPQCPSSAALRLWLRPHPHAPHCSPPCLCWCAQCSANTSSQSPGRLGLAVPVRFGPLVGPPGPIQNPHTPRAVTDRPAGRSVAVLSPGLGPARLGDHTRHTQQLRRLRRPLRASERAAVGAAPAGTPRCSDSGSTSPCRSEDGRWNWMYANKIKLK